VANRKSRAAQAPAPALAHFLTPDLKGSTALLLQLGDNRSARQQFAYNGLYHNELCLSFLRQPKSFEKLHGHRGCAMVVMASRGVSDIWNGK